MNPSASRPWLRAAAAVAVAVAVVCVPVGAQDRLKAMPGYDQFQKMSREIPGSVKLGTLNVQWQEDGASFEYAWDGKRYRYDVAARLATVIGDAPAVAPGGQGGADAAGRAVSSRRAGGSSTRPSPLTRR